MTDLPDTIGKFRIDGVLGEGGMGVVYRGWDPTLERPAAIKVIHAHLCQGPMGEQLLARFRNEAIAAARFSHPNVVPVYEFGEHAGSPFIAMAFIEGEELGYRLKAGERLTVESAVQVVTEVLHGLDYCHAHGVVHRDLKPANILVQSDGGVKITDFGIARLESSDLTQTGAVMGTMSYMSPEQHLGQVVDHRSDLFSVGVILYELLTGERPFPGRTNAMILHNVMNSPVVDPSRVNVHVTPALTPIVHKALATQPADRFQSAQEFAQALQHAASPDGVAPTQRPSPPVAVSPVKGPDTPAAGSTGASTVGDDSPTVIAEPVVQATPDKSTAPAAQVDHDSPTQFFDPQQTAVDPPPARSKTPAIAGIGAAIAVIALAGWWLSGTSTMPEQPAPLVSAPQSTNSSTTPEAAPVATAATQPTTVATSQPVPTDSTLASAPAVSDAPVPATVETEKLSASVPTAQPSTGNIETKAEPPVASSESTLDITSSPLGGGFPNAMLRVTSSPSGAIFMLNGEPIGITPLEVEVVPGSYEFAIRKARHRPAKRKTVLERGKRFEISSTLILKE